MPRYHGRGVIGKPKIILAAQTLGNASANNTNRDVTNSILMSNEKKKKSDLVSIHSFTRKLK